jgi:hypothetical protein
MPRKTFTAGEVLAAADVNTFLMDQSVMTFADSAARGSAIGTATEGMVTYLEDTDGLELWNGTAWTGVGGSGAVNAIINGAFDIWQRGTSFTAQASTAFSADRWMYTTAGGGTNPNLLQGAFAPNEIQALGFGDASTYLRMTLPASPNSSNNTIQRIEDVRTFAGQTVTFSFYAKANAATTIVTRFVQNFGSGGSGQEIIDNSVTIGTAWQRYSVTATLNSISGKTIGASSYLAVEVRWGNTANGVFDIWGVQLEAGSVATPFRRNANSLQGELAACQRYYFRTLASSAFAVIGGMGYTSNTTNTSATVSAPVTMRAAPTSVDFSQVAVQDSATLVVSVSSVTIDGAQTSNQFITTNNTSVGLTAGRFARQIANNNSAAFLGFSAEL